MGKNREFKKLSDRAYNVLRINRKDNLYLLTEHYRREGTFIKLRQCGPKLNEELIHFSRQLIHADTPNAIQSAEEHKQSVSFLKDVSQDTELLLPVLKAVQAMSTIESTFLELSDRARNMLLRNGITGGAAMVAFYEEHGTFLKLNHCGVATDKELTGYCQQILSNCEL